MLKGDVSVVPGQFRILSPRDRNNRRGGESKKREAGSEGDNYTAASGLSLFTF
jgi:hypothetical protein